MSLPPSWQVVVKYLRPAVPAQATDTATDNAVAGATKTETPDLHT